MSGQLMTSNQDVPTTSFGMPLIGFGTYRLRGFECFEAIETALATGYRHIDTAMAYENEAEIGRALDTADVARDQVFLTSKIKGYDEFLGPVQLRHSAEQTLRRLGVDTLDLLLVHWWNPYSDMNVTFGALSDLVTDGLVDNIGVSNFSSIQLEAAIDAASAPIVTNQVEYHPYFDQSELLSCCRDHEVVLTAYSPLAEGRVVNDRLLQTIGDRYGKSAAQVAIRWLLQQDGVATIPKSATPANIAANLEIYDFELSPTEMRQINALKGPLWYRLKREGGPIHTVRSTIGPYVPRRIRFLVP